MFIIDFSHSTRNNNTIVYFRGGKVHFPDISNIADADSVRMGFKSYTSGGTSSLNLSTNNQFRENAVMKAYMRVTHS